MKRLCDRTRKGLQDAVALPCALGALALLLLVVAGLLGVVS